jgi:hypothetical protein
MDVEIYKRVGVEVIAVVCLFLAVMYYRKRDVDEMPEQINVVVYGLGFLAMNLFLRATFPFMADVLLSSTIFHIGGLFHQGFVR